MHRTISFPALAALAMLLLFACTYNPAHLPDPELVPLFKRQGETRVSVSQEFQADRGTEAQVAVAAGKHVALTAAGAYSQLDNCWSCAIAVRRHLELGAGAFDVTESGWVREVYAGLGAGRFKVSGVTAKYDPGLGDETVNQSHYREAFLQGDLGRNGKFADLGLAMRLAAFKYSGFAAFDVSGAPKPAPTDPWGLFLEPALTFRAGFRLFKAESQLGFSIPLHEAAGLDNEWVWLSLGLGIDAFGR